jgi:hypothetical protein
MKKFYFTPLAAAVMLASNAIMASEVEKYIGLYVSDISYEEPGVMTQDGTMLGITASYASYDAVMLKAEGSYAQGEVDYSGSGTINNIDDYIFEVRGLAGKNFVQESGVRITPFVGLGYRYLNDDMSGRVSSTGAAGYEREQEYIYSPIGVEFSNNKLNNAWVVGGSIEYDYFWEGTNHTNLGSIPGYYNVTMNQNDGHGYRASIRFTKTDGNTTFMIEPFYRYWDIDDSDITVDPSGTGWYEPNNTSKEIGVNLSLKF